MRVRMAASASARWTRVLMPIALGQIVTDQRLHRQPGFHRQFNRIRQVVFPFFGKRDAVQGIPQPVGRETVRADVQLLDGQLLRRGGGFLDNGLHIPIRIPDHPPKATRVGGDDGQHGDRAGVFLLGLDQAVEGLGAQERHIGIGDQHQVRFAAQAGFGLLDGMPGAQRRVLDHTVGCLPEESRAAPAHPCPMTTTGFSVLAEPAASRAWAIIGFPQTGCSTFGKSDFMRVPWPAARRTAVTFMSISCSPRNLPRACC